VKEKINNPGAKEGGWKFYERVQGELSDQSFPSTDMINFPPFPKKKKGAGGTHKKRYLYLCW
jgi:hypothetical protein